MKVRSISVWPKTLTMETKSYYSDASVEFSPPIFVDDTEVVWSSNDESVVTVDPDTGIMFAEDNGFATVTVALKSDHTIFDTISVTVENPPITSITLNPTSVTLKEGEKAHLTATIVPSYSQEDTIWFSSNTNVARINGGDINAISCGRATIIVMSAKDSNVKAVCEVTVEPILVSSVSVTPKTLVMKVGEKKPISATVLPENATEKTVTWSVMSSDSETVDVESNGCVCAMGVGHAIVTATTTGIAEDGKRKGDSCDVYVVETLPEKLTIEPASCSVAVGMSTQLSATVLPETTTYDSVFWECESKYKSIIDVDRNTGLVTGKAIGTAVAKAYVGLTPSVYSTCVINVTPYVAVSNIEFCPEKMTMFVGETANLSPLVYPSNASDQSIVWSSYDSTIVSVDESGKITAKKGGTSVITARTVNGKEASVEVTVYIDTVTIKPDGDHKLNTKVVFNSSGKVWYCINKDMIYDEQNMNDTSLIRRSARNLYVDPDASDGTADSTLRVWNADEIKLLYAIDPCGVSKYIQDYAAKEIHGLEDSILHKDKMFRLLFGREPRYFEVNYSEEWRITTDKSNLQEVLSESEYYFGFHPVFNTLRQEIAWKEFLLAVVCFAIRDESIVGLIAENMLETRFVWHKISLLCEDGAYDAAVEEACSYATGGVAGTIVDDMNILPGYVFEIINLVQSFVELINSLLPVAVYHCATMDYVLKNTAYEIIVELSGGENFDLKTIHDALNQYI
ncbi:MAG: Ig domain-containing protein [Ruminococcaceae bacterium]|nr:Ig domain-containing protein [Oscillospiraceae bacterium]